jgi:hypothetical protein
MDALGAGPIKRRRGRPRRARLTEAQHRIAVAEARRLPDEIETVDVIAADQWGNAKDVAAEAGVHVSLVHRQRKRLDGHQAAQAAKQAQRLAEQAEIDAELQRRLDSKTAERMRVAEANRRRHTAKYLLPPELDRCKGAASRR